MNNFNYFFPPASASPTFTEQDQTFGQAQSFGQAQTMPEAWQVQPASFAGLDTRVHPLEQTQVPGLPPVSQQTLQPRQLSTLNVSPIYASQYLSQLALPSLDNPPLDPFLAISTYQPTLYDEDSSLFDYDHSLVSGADRVILDNVNLDDVDEVMREKLQEEYVSVPPELNRPSSHRAVTISIAEDTIDESVKDHFERALAGTQSSTTQDATGKAVDEHFERSLAGARKKKHSRGRHFKSRGAAALKAITADVKMAASATSTVPPAELSTVPAAIPVRVDSIVSTAADNSPSEQASYPIDQWLIVKEWYERPYHCGYPGCSKTYKLKSHLVQHIIKHSGISKFKCPYPECVDKKCFRDSAVLIRHIRSVHTLEKPFICDLCHRRFGRPDRLKLHRKNAHLINDEQISPKRKSR